MNLNEGTVDRTLRVIVGIVILLQFFVFPASPLRYWALVGLVPLLTGLVGYCPAYSLIGLNTCRTKNAGK